MTRLAEARGYLELALDDVEERTGIAHLEAIETGRRDATELEMARLSRLYGYSIAYLRDGDDEGDDHAVEAVARLGELTPEDRHEALRFAVFLRHAGAHDR
jgi:transcriptional regulator with XRE-family HTH domain